ncbi:uncharacterized protein LOC128391091 [Panonychus citri]|uniref:uncharacterized protein LOC128391091 n=1 Tax=Panonychus citri TaxID=50023 RepID=UPI002307DDC1|nr:uncharacterized protein LOC128391091 [Panonychus citri]
MIKQVLSILVMLTVISTIKSEPSPKNILTFNCQKMLEEIKNGSFEKIQKELDTCREQAIPKDVLAAVNKCGDQLPMKSADQVAKICADIDGNVAKFEEVLKCHDQALGKENLVKFKECCKKSSEGNRKPPQ